MSKHSLTVDEFYATPTETAEWAMNIVRSCYDLEGKTAFEPCVGGFVFPDAAPELDWTTNDLNVWTDRKPDTQLDFLENDFGTYDFIITNPPFGTANKLAFAFMKKATTMANVVVAVLPNIFENWSKRMDNAIARDMRMISCVPCKNQWFDLPDGSKRDVRCHLVIFERDFSYSRPVFTPPVQDKRKDLLDFNDEGKFCLRVFGDGIGDVRVWSPDEKLGCFVRFDTHGKQSAVLKLIATYPWRYLYGNAGQRRAPWGNLPKKNCTITPNQVLQHVNNMAVLEGRMPPIEGVDYEAFLENFQKETMFGLTLPSV